MLDRAFNVVVGARTLDDYTEPRVDRLQAWPEAVKATQTGRPTSEVRSAPDLTPVISSAVPFDRGVLLATDNDRTFTKTVRRQRALIVGAMGIVILVSILLSMFLARTIVRPLRRLALAAHRVRLGRAREVNVPRLPRRSDEIGLLARSVSDMSQSLRQRIDNIEAFAADDASGSLHEDAQHRELAARQRDPFATEHDVRRREVQHQAPDLDAVIDQPLRTTRQRADAGSQLAQVERLHQVVVRAHVQTLDARLGGVPRGHDEDGGPDAIPASLEQQIDPVATGEAEIQQDQVEQGIGQGGGAAAPVGQPGDGIRLLLQRMLDRSAQLDVVF